jgi:hypothetical protein
MTITGAAYQGELVSGRLTGDRGTVGGRGFSGKADAERGRKKEKFFIMACIFLQLNVVCHSSFVICHLSFVK